MISFDKYDKVVLRVQKVKDLRFEGEHPNAVYEGSIRTGLALVGLCNHHQSLVISKGQFDLFYTSTVESIEEFEGYDLLITENSIYRVEPVWSSLPGVQEKHNIKIKA